MKTYKSIERNSIILGMPVRDLMLLLCLLLLLVLLGGIMGTFMPVSKYYYLGSLLLVTFLQFVLKYLNRRKHPTFVASRISYYFLQARRIAITSNLFYHGTNRRNPDPHTTR
jgi:hypothetical protein